jgi:Lycopene cyclase
MGTRRTGQPSPSGSWVVLGMLAMISVPAALTLHTVQSSAFRPVSEVVAGDPSPYGYSVSLLIFVTPIVAIGFWLLRPGQARISQRAFWWTAGILFPLGAALDFFLAQFFFRYPNPGATLRIGAPALGGAVPVEEYLFYLTGFLAVLTIYVWLDSYWLQAFAVPDDDTQRTDFGRLLGFHPGSFLLAVVLIGGGIVYRRMAEPGSPGFPGYLTFLVLTALLPSIALYRAVNRVINWRALNLTLFMILLISLLWEVTLAIPYGWWAYQPSAMVGVYIRAWDNLPIEAVFVWISVTYMTVLVYETIRNWHASGRSMGDALFRRVTKI